VCATPNEKASLRRALLYYQPVSATPHSEPATETEVETPKTRRGEFGKDIGTSLRSVRESRGVSLRELARRVGISASAISQIETGRSRPSVETLYGIVRELGIALDDLFPAEAGARAGVRSANSAASSLVQPAGTRQSIDLESGVRWERLTPTTEPDVDFLYVTYDVDGSSSVNGTLMRHAGREYGLVLEGALRVTVGFDTHVLHPGDSIAFDSTTPHLLQAADGEQAKAVWFVVGRRDSDARKSELDGAPGLSGPV
jgi:transcriptional regulator with XRE-family HTH domain